MNAPVIGPVLTAIATRIVAPDRARNRWAWVVGGAFAGLSIHAAFDIGRSRLLAVAGCVAGFAIAQSLESRLIRSAAHGRTHGRKTLALTRTHLAVLAGRVIGNLSPQVVAAVPLAHIESIRVENVGRRWKRAVGYAVVGVIFASEFVVISQNLLILGAIFTVIVVALAGVATTSDVWIRFTDGRQWKFNVLAAEWLDFYPAIPGLKWRGSGDGTRLEDDALAGL